MGYTKFRLRTIDVFHRSWAKTLYTEVAVPYSRKIAPYIERLGVSPVPI